MELRWPKRLNFSVDKHIVLHGLCLFGSKDNDYEVMLEIKDSSDNSTMVSESAIFYSKLMLYIKAVLTMDLKFSLTLRFT